MPTSELSDALNPHVVQSRSRPSSSYTDLIQPVIQPPPRYIPHRSELELAISEPPPPPPRARTQPSAEGVQAVQELLRTLSATREAQEIERTRRLAWEQEQEAKYTLKQVEMERQMFEMRQEIASLRSSVAGKPPVSVPTTLSVPQFNGSPSVARHQLQLELSPVSPVSLPSSHSQTPFIEASNHQLQQQTYYAETTNNHNIRGEHPDLMNIPPSPITPLSPTASGKPSTPRLASVRKNRRKRQTSNIPTDEGEDTSATESSTTSTDRRPVKRVNRHDHRCLTIHQAMRAHILNLMQLEADQDLPDSHVESMPLELHDPVRFVWDKTTKQSVHNSRMKARVLADFKSNRRLYKHVPDKDFNKKTLESVFDQIFVTFRQKFKAQTDAWTAISNKKKDDSRARKSRRLSRRKIKLTNRAEARMRLKTFEHVTFDGALQLDCMSSEESDSDNASSSRQSDILRIRRLPWRSSRLQRFYDILDDEETLDKRQRPKRGSGKKARCLGLPKAGFFIPPQGVASWMISRRWINMSVMTHSDLPDALKNIVFDPPGLDWDYFRDLGVESDDELHTIQEQCLQNGHYNSHGDTSSTSSLHNALASR